MSDDHKHFNAEKIFFALFVFTALEVAWGILGNKTDMSRIPLWGGLMLCAVLKGYLIMAYFMHFKFEGWIVKGLIAPTPFLIIYMMLILWPDVGDNDKLDFPIGSQLDQSVVTDEHYQPVLVDGVPQRHDTYKTVLVDMGEHDAKDEEDAGGGH